MNKTIILVIIVLLFCINASAQEINGSVMNEKDEPMEYANVALMTRVDSTLITGGVTDAEGRFRLSAGFHNLDSLMVRVTSVGYATEYSDLPMDGPIHMKPLANELAGVTITGVSKHVTTNASGLTVNMEGNPLSKLPTAIDAIRMMPMIDASKSGIVVLGKGSPEIYINNRKIRDTDELNQLSPEDIKSVDIITTPSVKYGSTVTSVIIVHTKKRDFGLAGVMRGSGTFGQMTSGDADADLSYMLHNGLGFFLGENVSGDKMKEDRLYSDDFNDNKSHTVTTGDHHSRELSMKVTSGIGYDLSETNSIGMRYEFSRTPKFRYFANDDINMDIDGDKDDMSSHSHFDMQNTKHYLNAYATFQFGKKKNYELTADADYLYGSNRNDQNTTENNHDQEDHITTANNTDYHLAATKANLNMTFGKVAIDVGGEYSYTNNHTIFESNKTGASADDDIRQNLTAGYANLVYTPDKYWTLIAGMRVEVTDVTYYQNGKRIDGQSESYTDWKPRLNISYSKGDWKVGLAYKPTTGRPVYSMLNNNVTYATHTQWVTGNPLLRSCNSFNIDLNMSWKQTYFDISYYREKDHIEYVYHYLPEYGINLRKPENLPDFNVVISTLSHSMDIGFWHPKLECQFAIADLKYGTPQNTYNKPIGGITLQNRFDLPKEIYAYLIGSWVSRGNNNTYYMYDTSCVSVYLLKSIGKWSFSILADDLFGTQRRKFLTSTNGVNAVESRKGTTRVVELSVTYSFNKKHKKSYKGKGTGSSELQRF